jgi:hypothetical protein
MVRPLIPPSPRTLSNSGSHRISDHSHKSLSFLLLPIGENGAKKAEFGPKFGPKNGTNMEGLLQRDASGLDSSTMIGR